MKKRSQKIRKKRRSVLILGAGGLGKAILEAFHSRGEFQVSGFLDDEKQGKFCGLPIFGKIDDVAQIAERKKIPNTILAIGYHYQRRRAELFEKFEKEKSIRFVNAIHRDAKLATDVTFGKGIFIGMNVVVNTGTRIGDHTVIWTGSIIEHDNVIGKNVFIATGTITAGYVQIEDNVFVGMGALIAKSRIGKNATIGAGSVVLKDVEPSTYVKGIPAKFSARKSEQSYLVHA